MTEYTYLCIPYLSSLFLSDLFFSAIIRADMAHPETSTATPSEPERYDDLGIPAPEDIPAVVAQVELTGAPRTVEVGHGKLHEGTEPVRIFQERVVRVVIGLNTATGDHEAHALTDTALNGGELRHEPLARYACIYDAATEGKPSLSSARKGGASRPFVDTEAAVLARGGDPGYKIKKPAHSFGLPNTYIQLYGETTQPEAVQVLSGEADDLADIEF